jgi:X-Pro dipeptidyl-peptidase (S15 family)
MLAAQMSVASYAQQAYQFGKCDVAPANREAALRSVYIAMPDGVKIAADVILPRDLTADAKLPAVLTQTRYWRATEGRQPTGADRYWINHGYAVVNTDVRGTGASFGRWPAPWSRDEVRDMGDVTKWIVAQAWSNGKVVTIGTSPPSLTPRRRKASTFLARIVSGFRTLRSALNDRRAESVSVRAGYKVLYAPDVIIMNHLFRMIRLECKFA